jgi:hypothetical protein
MTFKNNILIFVANYGRIELKGERPFSENSGRGDGPTGKRISLKTPRSDDGSS